MTEERAEHPQEPAEGSQEDVEAPGAEGSEKEGEGTTEDAPKPGQHPQEPAEGSEEDVEEARGAQGP